mmetsp:Transcript_29606/g.65561  ORF Transcript_29606/g.65561 Transcript_29606/m.65561 type:complete len:218 (-) Transcript_29606:43-696(-)
MVTTISGAPLTISRCSAPLPPGTSVTVADHFVALLKGMACSTRYRRRRRTVGTRRSQYLSRPVSVASPSTGRVSDCRLDPITRPPPPTPSAEVDSGSAAISRSDAVPAALPLPLPALACCCCCCCWASGEPAVTKRALLQTVASVRSFMRGELRDQVTRPSSRRSDRRKVFLLTVISLSPGSMLRRGNTGWVGVEKRGPGGAGVGPPIPPSGGKPSC